MNKVHQLRLAGYKLRISHFRFSHSNKTEEGPIRSDLLNGYDIDTQGGMCLIELRTPKGSERSNYVLIPRNSNYNKKLIVSECLKGISLSE